ncbi:hypothetical protein ACZ90_57305 [Streptomyces albus subsp. albus]|nr:hypothetical protein ACZ90_57305 [Streptomyces albus subsp. albus]
MRSWKKIAAVPGLLIGLAVTGLGAAQAYDGGPNGCSRDAQGNVVCVQQSDNTYVSDDGTQHVHQSKNCTAVYENRLTGGSSTGQYRRQGRTVNCSNSAQGESDDS